MILNKMIDITQFEEYDTYWTYSYGKQKQRWEKHTEWEDHHFLSYYLHFNHHSPSKDRYMLLEFRYKVPLKRGFLFQKQYFKYADVKDYCTAWLKC